MRTPQGLPTASRLQLAMACAASQVMPVADTEWAAGDAGRERHDVLADFVAAPPGSPSTCPAHLVGWLEGVEDAAEQLRHPDTLTELALAYDVATGTARVLGRNLGRHYPETAPTEFYGSFDYVRVFDGEALVADLKTGMGEVPHPSRNAQLRFGALAVARSSGVDTVRAGILHAPEGRNPWWEWTTFDAFDLSEIAVEMKTLSERIGYARSDYQKGKTPRLRVGEHCGNCKARHSCPARVAMAKRLGGEPENVVQDLKAALNPETAAVALARWQAAVKAMQEVGNALYAYATENPIPLGDGRVWGPRTFSREVIDAEKAWPVLVEKYGPEVARKCMSLDTSKAGIERGMTYLRESARGAAVRPKGMPEAGKVTAKRLNEEALTALRDAGCMTQKERREFEAHVPERLKLVPAPTPLLDPGPPRATSSSEPPPPPA